MITGNFRAIRGEDINSVDFSYKPTSDRYKDGITETYSGVNVKYAVDIPINSDINTQKKGF